jgi:hypothetical protein
VTFYFNADLWVSLSAYVTPLNITPLSVKFWQPVVWGTDPNNQWAVGFDPFSSF